MRCQSCEKKIAAWRRVPATALITVSRKVLKVQHCLTHTLDSTMNANTTLSTVANKPSPIKPASSRVRNATRPFQSSSEHKAKTITALNRKAQEYEATNRALVAESHRLRLELKEQKRKAAEDAKASTARIAELTTIRDNQHATMLQLHQYNTQLSMAIAEATRRVAEEQRKFVDFVAQHQEEVRALAGVVVDDEDESSDDAEYTAMAQEIASLSAQVSTASTIMHSYLNTISEQRSRIEQLSATAAADDEEAEEEELLMSGSVSELLSIDTGLLPSAGAAAAVLAGANMFSGRDSAPFFESALPAPVEFSDDDDSGLLELESKRKTPEAAPSSPNKRSRTVESTEADDIAVAVDEDADSDDDDDDESEIVVVDDEQEESEPEQIERLAIPVRQLADPKKKLGRAMLQPLPASADDADKASYRAFSDSLKAAGITVPKLHSNGPMPKKNTNSVIVLFRVAGDSRKSALVAAAGSETIGHLMLSGVRVIFADTLAACLACDVIDTPAAFAALIEEHAARCKATLAPYNTYGAWHLKYIDGKGVTDNNIDGRVKAVRTIVSKNGALLAKPKQMAAPFGRKPLVFSTVERLGTDLYKLFNF